jgi:hypothetical protein
LPDEYITCRAVMHAWQVTVGWGVETEPNHLQANWAWEERHCSRCGTIRQTVYDGQLRLLSTVYLYAPGYGVVGPSADGWRVEARRELWARRVGPQPLGRGDEDAREGL